MDLMSKDDQKQQLSLPKSWQGEYDVVEVDGHTEPSFGMQRGPGKLVVHPALVCAGQESCVIHNPSEHHMRSWPLNWRADSGIMERICPEHGIGHPDPDEMTYQKRIGNSWAGVHGCCGCCW